MRNVVRIVSILTALVICMYYMVCDAYASHATTITMNTVSDATQGDVIDVYLDLANNTGIAGAELLVTYDATQLTYIEGAITSGASMGQAISDIVKISEGKIKITIVYNAESIYNGSFAIFSFKVKAKPGNVVKMGLTVDTLVDIDYNHVQNVATGTQLTIAEDTTVRGDVNSDNKLSITDAVLLKQHLAGMPTDINAVASDLNSDNKIDVADAVLIMQYLAGYDVLNK